MSSRAADRTAYCARCRGVRPIRIDRTWQGIVTTTCEACGRAWRTESGRRAEGGRSEDTSFYNHGPGRRAELRDETIEQQRAHLAGCEQILNALTPLHKRNPPSIQRALTRDGYAVYDGPKGEPR